jgi:hypothetical protein
MTVLSTPISLVPPSTTGISVPNSAIINHLIAVFVFGDSNLGKRSKNLLV